MSGRRRSGGPINRDSLPGLGPMTSVRARRRSAIGDGVGSVPARPAGLELDVGLPRSAPSSGQEFLHLEDDLPLEQMIGRPAQLVGQDGEGLGLSVLALELLEEALALGVVAQEQDGGLGEGPLEVDVADLAASGAEPFAGGLLRALDEAGVGGEILDPGEAADVVDLVEEGEGEDLADAGEGAEAVEGVGVVPLDGADEVELEVADEAVVVGDQIEVDLDALADAGVEELLGDPIPVGLVDNFPRSCGRRCGRSWPCRRGWLSCRGRGRGRRGCSRERRGRRASTRRRCTRRRRRDHRDTARWSGGTRPERP